jgi:hypothetical protein
MRVTRACNLNAPLWISGCISVQFNFEFYASRIGGDLQDGLSCRAACYQICEEKYRNRRRRRTGWRRDLRVTLTHIRRQVRSRLRRTMQHMHPDENACRSRGGGQKDCCQPGPAPACASLRPLSLLESYIQIPPLSHLVLQTWNRCNSSGESSPSTNWSTSASSPSLTRRSNSSSANRRDSKSSAASSPSLPRRKARTSSGSCWIDVTNSVYTLSV